MTATGKRPISIGVLGCSSIAHRRFIPALLESHFGRLEFIGSRYLEKSKAFADLFGCPNYGLYDDVIRSRSIDLVYISTPPTERLALLKAAIQSGKHVLCEKPLLHNTELVQSVLKLASEYGVRVFENYAYLCHPQHKMVRELISRNTLGPVKSIDIIYTYPLPEKDNIRLRPELGGGVVNDSLGYPISLAQYLFGSKFQVSSVKINVSNSFGVDTNCAFDGFIANSIKLSARVAMNEEYCSSYKIIGEKGVIYVHRAFSVNESHKAVISLEIGSEKQDIIISPVNQFLIFLESCISSIERKNRASEGRILAVRRAMDKVIDTNKLNRRFCLG